MLLLLVLLRQPVFLGTASYFACAQTCCLFVRQQHILLLRSMVDIGGYGGMRD